MAVTAYVGTPNLPQRGRQREWEVMYGRDQTGQEQDRTAHGGFLRREHGSALVPFDDRPLTSNFSGRHSRVASCSSAEKHPCSSGGDYDIAPKAMPLLGWDERRGTAPLYHPMWRPTDHVPWCRLCTCFCSNKPSPPCPFHNAHCSRGASHCRPHSRGGLHAATRLY